MKGIDAQLVRSGIYSNWRLRGQARDEKFDVAPVEDGRLRVRIEECQFTSVDFSGLAFDLFYAAGSRFERCNFSKATFLQLGFGQAQKHLDPAKPIKPTDPRYPQTVYEDCIFLRTRFDPNNTHFGNSRFVRCTFEHAWLRKLFTWTAEFLDCRFAGKVIECTFHGTITDKNNIQRIGRTSNEIRGNDFSEADLVWTAFRDVDLHAQRFPSDGSYAILDQPTAQIDAAIRLAGSGPTGDLKGEVLHQLGLLGQSTRFQHGQALIRKGQLGWRTPAEIEDLMWEYLTAATTL